MELIRKLFDPSLNLFRKTSHGHVYPSAVTSLSDTNHLELIEFSGKMLAKAVYEVSLSSIRFFKDKNYWILFYFFIFFSVGYSVRCPISVFLPQSDTWPNSI